MISVEHIDQFEVVLNTFSGTVPDGIAHHSIRSRLNKIENSYVQSLNNTEVWTEIGSIALERFCSFYPDSDKSNVVTKLAVFLAKKRHDYGVKNIVEFGEFGIKVRTVDKIARIENMISRGGETAVGEPITDAWKDIVGYSAVAILLISGKYA